jgi:hypothetical protein
MSKSSMSEICKRFVSKEFPAIHSSTIVAANVFVVVAIALPAVCQLQAESYQFFSAGEPVGYNESRQYVQRRIIVIFDCLVPLSSRMSPLQRGICLP